MGWAPISGSTTSSVDSWWDLLVGNLVLAEGVYVLHEPGLAHQWSLAFLCFVVHRAGASLVYCVYDRGQSLQCSARVWAFVQVRAEVASSMLFVA